jgi:hypothetical protein
MLQLAEELTKEGGHSMKIWMKLGSAIKSIFLYEIPQSALEKLEKRVFLRYVIGLPLLVLGWFVMVKITGYKHNTYADVLKLSPLLFVLVSSMTIGIFCMHEIAFWVLGAVFVGVIVAAVVGLMAALPVSAAIIIAALILASPSRKQGDEK